MLNFLSISFISACFLIFIPPNKRITTGIMAFIICGIFLMSSFLYTYSNSVSTRPDVTFDEYVDLLTIRQLINNGTINSTGILSGKEFQFGYTLIWITGMYYDRYDQDNSSLALQYEAPIYKIVKNKTGQPLPYPAQMLNYTGKAILVFYVNWTYA